MTAKYDIEYSVPSRGHATTQHHYTDDPVACEEFISRLLERQFNVCSVQHDGADLPKSGFDRLIKTAAGMLSTRKICAALGIDSVQAHYRFGVPA